MQAALPLILLAPLLILLGLIAGSFLSTLVVRWPQGQTLGGRSACDGCRIPLRPLDLIPLFSWGLTRGRCRHCQRPINPLHPLFELACALIGLLAVCAAPTLQGIAGALLGWLLLTLCALDKAHYWLPDRLTYPLLALGLLFGFGAFSDRLIGALIGGGGLLILYAIHRLWRGHEGIGLGDVKLLAGLGAWLGAWNLPLLLLLSALFGLIFVMKVQRNGSRATSVIQVPFGACLAIGAYPLWLMTVALGTPPLLGF